MEYGLAYLKQKLFFLQPRLRMRYGYYEMKNLTFDFGISTPPELQYWNAVVGWCAKGVDAMADRLKFRKFKNDLFGLEQILNLNNRDILLPSLWKGALISACDFVYLSEGEDGFPRMQAIDGMNGTGIIDNTTGMLREGYAVLERDEMKMPTKEAYFTFDYTAYYEGGRLVDWRENKAPYPCLVPVIYKPDATRPFGHSRISRACMSATGSALRTIKRSEISAEFYSFPQKWVTGLDPTSEEDLDKWTAAMSAMMQFDRNSDGSNDVKLGQFQQQSMTPHTEQLRMFAALFAGEVGLTMDDLGFASANPSSEEAIKASHENLRLAVKSAQDSFGVGLLNACFLAACIRDNYKYNRQQLYSTGLQWAPPFPADASMLGAIGDALGKIGANYPTYMDEDKIYELTGI
ncbi:MAG: phage portal protein [Oscillospiraceae bacterium]|nr:phage portal protein [Oscillospiraceae bacterium]